MAKIQQLLLIAALAVVPAACVSPGIGNYKRQDPAAPNYAGPTVQFLGVSTLVFESKGTAVATDGFFTRPSAFKFLFGKIGPDENEVARVKGEAGIDKLAAVIAVHSHYDHAMDSPILAGQSEALLIGSESTGMIGAGVGFDPKRFRAIEKYNPISLPHFKISFVPSVHGPTPEWTNASGAITEPLVPPARFGAYKEGTSYSVFFEIEGESNKTYTALVHASAGYVEGALNGRQADVVYLGIAPLGDMEPDKQELYWKNVVCAVHPRLVIPIHWDNLFATLHKGEDLKPMYTIMHDYDAAMAFVVAQAAKSKVEVLLPRPWIKTSPFENMGPKGCN